MKASFTMAIRTGRAFFKTGLMKSSLSEAVANDRIFTGDSASVHYSFVLCPGLLSQKGQTLTANLEPSKSNRNDPAEASNTYTI